MLKSPRPVRAPTGLVAVYINIAVDTAKAPSIIQLSSCIFFPFINMRQGEYGRNQSATASTPSLIYSVIESATHCDLTFSP